MDPPLPALPPNQEREELKEDETTLMRLAMELMDMVSSRSLRDALAATKEKYEVGEGGDGDVGV